MTYLRISLLLIAVSLLVSCRPDEVGIPVKDEPVAPYTYQQPASKSDGWTTAPAATVDISEAVLVDMTRAIINGEFEDYPLSNVDSILIAKDGKLVYEHYFTGYDGNVRRQVRSISKSIISMLVGIAWDDGTIQNLDMSILPLFAQYSPFGDWDPRKNDITLKHLLTMTSGINCADGNSLADGNEADMFKHDNWVNYFLDLPMAADPGTMFSYCAASVVTAEAVLVAYGRIPMSIQQNQLFEPLGIVDYEWTTAMPPRLLHPNGLAILPRDLLKLGQVMLTGEWNGIPILSQEWRDMSTAVQFVQDNGDEVGYLWYRDTMTINGATENLFYAKGGGVGATFLVVIPSYNTVVVMTAAGLPGVTTGQLVAVFNSYIEGALGNQAP